MFDASQNTIAVLGASARAAAFSLLRSGQQVVCADLFADADLAQPCEVHQIENYPEGFENWLRQVECEGWVYTGALENYPELVDRLAQVRPLLGTSGDGLRRVREPLILQQVLAANGFHFPETIKAGAQPMDSKAWLAKSYAGSSSSGSGVDIVSAPYWQRFLQGTPLSAVYLDEQLLGVTEQLVGESWAGAAKFQYCGSVGPWPLAEQYADELLRLGKFLRQEFDLQGWFGVDLIFAEHALWVIEINPRYTASIEIVERNRHSRTGSSGKAILFAKSPITITNQLSQDWLREARSSEWPQLADIPQPGAKIDLGQPILTLFAEAASTETVRRKLQLRAADIEQVIYSSEPLGAARCD